LRRITLLFAYIWRSAQTLSISLFILFAFLFRRVYKAAIGPRLLRWYFETSGGGFVKIGQILAMRYDLLPERYCEELSRLLDGLPPASTAKIIKIIESDFGRPLNASFLSFNPNPIASASVSQVYEAVLLDGTQVVVKVRRPGIVWRYRVDFINAKIFARLLDRIGLFGELNISRLTIEFINLAKEELDFYQEARNAQLMHESMQQDELDHYAPKVYLSLCSPSVITLEKLEGVWMTDILRTINANDQRQIYLWEQQGISLKRTARLLLRSTLVQCFSHRLYHADPHAANLILLKGGTLAYVDFGMVGWLDERSWSQQFKLREYIANEMLHAAYQTLLDILEPIPNRDLTGFEYKIKNLMRNYILASKNPNASLMEKSSGYFFLRVCDEIRREHLIMPSSVMRLYRTMGIADMVMLKLYPSINWVPELREFIGDETSRQLCILASRQQVQATLNTLLMNLINAPQIAGDVLDWAQHRLPELGRSYIRQLSLLEQATILVLKYFRTGAFILGIVILGSHWLVPRFYSSKLWISFNEAVGPWWWLIAGGSLLLAFMIGRLIKRLGIP
jgi:ubiquinone biosynthesis protein